MVLPLFVVGGMAEEGEVDTSVGAMFHEVGALAEIMVLAVFEHEEASFLEQVGTHHSFGQFAQFRKSIGRIGKHEVELFAAAVDELQGIAAEGGPGLVGQCTLTLGDEGEVTTVLLDGHHLLASARKKFERDATRSAEEVECTGFFKFDVGTQHVEEVFLGKIRCGTCLERTGYLKMAAFVDACDDSHGSYGLGIVCYEVV